MSKYTNIAITNMILIENEGKTSELSIEAAKALLQKVEEKNDIKVLILVTQEGDFLFPATAFVVHKELKLSKDCIVYDINAGTDGFLTALEITSGLLQAYDNTCSGVVIAAEQGKAVATHVKKVDDLYAEFSHKTYPELWDTVWESRWEEGRECKIETFLSVIEKETMIDINKEDAEYTIFPQRDMDDSTLIDSSVLIPMEMIRKMDGIDGENLRFFCKGIGTGCSVTEAYLCVCR